MAWREFLKLSPAMQGGFLRAAHALAADLRDRILPRPGLRVKGVQGHEGVFEITFAPDGRATFEYGRPVRPGHAHVIWRRIGTHDVLRNP